MIDEKTITLLGDNFQKGQLAFNENRIEEAEQYFKKLIVEYPENEFSNLCFGMVLLRKNSLEEAEQYFTKALAIAPTIASIQNGMGLIRFSQNRFEEASDYFERTIAFGDKSGEGLKNFILSLQRMGKYSEALERSKKFVEANPCIDSFTIAASSAFALGEYSTAISLSFKALEIDPNNVKSLLTIADGYFKMGIFKETVKHYLHALSINPDLRYDIRFLSRLRKGCESMLPSNKLDLLKDGEYLQAMEEVIFAMVDQNCITIENDTYTGIASLMAIKAGAQTVYICEQNQVLQEKIKIMILENNLQGTPTMVNTLSTDERSKSIFTKKADLFLHDPIKNGWFASGVFEATRHAKGELLKSSGKILPGAAKFRCRLVEAKEFYQDNRLPIVEGWNLMPLNDFTPMHVSVDGVSADSFKILSEDQELLRVDLNELDDHEGEIKLSLQAIKNGVCHGILLWPELEIGDKVINYTPNNKLKYRQVGMQLLDQPLEVKKDEVLHLAFRYINETYTFVVIRDEL